MSDQNGGTAEQSAPTSGESKFDRAVEAMKTLGEEAAKGNLDNSSTSKAEEEKSEDKPTKKDGSTESKEDWEKRYNNVQSHADKMAARAEKLARQVIDNNPNYIHELAKEDMKLANKIIAADLKDQGIKTYEELVKALEYKDKPKDQVEILKRLEETEKKLSAKEEADEIAKIESFISEKGDVDDELANKISEVLEKGDFTLEEAYDFAKFKLGRTATESKSTEADANAEAASKISTIGSRGGKSQISRLSSKEIQILEGLGATKTLAKHGIK